MPINNHNLDKMISATLSKLDWLHIICGFDGEDWQKESLNKLIKIIEQSD